MLRRLAAGIVRKLLASHGYEVQRTDGFPRLDFPFELLSYLVYRERHRSPDFFFVQLGSSAQLIGDRFEDIIREHQLRGVIVEANADRLAKLRETYRDQAQIQFVGCAVGAPRTSATTSFQELCRKCAIPRVDLLYVDCDEHVRNSVNTVLEAGIRPTIIRYAGSNFTSRDSYELKMLLLDCGYRFIDVGANTVCLRVERPS